MSTLRVIPLALLALFLALSSAQATILFEATLTGDQEVPPVPTMASGTASLALNDDMDRLEIFIEIFGLDLDGMQTPADDSDDVAAMHIHAAPPGVNGGVVFGFIGPNSDLNMDLVINPVAGTVFSAWDLAEGNGTTLAAQLPNLFDGGLYVNVHTPVNPGGEIRGQINRVPEPATLILLSLGLASLWSRRRRAQ